MTGLIWDKKTLCFIGFILGRTKIKVYSFKFGGKGQILVVGNLVVRCWNSGAKLLKII